MFGQQAQNQPMGGSLFGSTANTQQQQQGTGGMFGAKSAGPAATGSALFGSSIQQNAPQQTSIL